MDEDFENEILALSNTQRDIIDEYDDNLERIKNIYINTLIDIQHSLNELKKKELQNDLDNDIHNSYDNYQETITELLDTPFNFLSNMEQLNSIMPSTYNNTFGNYQSIGRFDRQQNDNIEDNNTELHNYNNNDDLYNASYRNIINNVNLSDKTKFKRHCHKNLKECDICYKEKKYFIEILSCKHSFCNGCIKRWVKEHPNCPICRTHI
jgi:hypothetical protein